MSSLLLTNLLFLRLLVKVNLVVVDQPPTYSSYAC